MVCLGAASTEGESAGVRRPIRRQAVVVASRAAAAARRSSHFLRSFAQTGPVHPTLAAGAADCEIN